MGYLQPVGLVVAPAAMVEAGWVLTRSGSELLERQERYREALEPISNGADTEDNDGERGFRRLADLLTEHLGWHPDQLASDPGTIAAYTRELHELGETLAPTAVVPAAAGEGAQLLVIELLPAAAFDQKVTDGEHLWRASAQERLERLLRETGVEAGLLFNGGQLRLVVAPKGESSGHLTFRLADLAEVSGRLMFSGLDLLLGQSHVFLDPAGYRLTDVLKKSRSFQAVVSNALADQVLAALWDLLRGFQQADALSRVQDEQNPLLGDLPDRDPQQLYGGLITVLMRLVFLLYAEDEALMPSDAVYEQNYKLSAIFEQLQQDESEYPDTMEQRFGAWAGLMSLCRLVFDGGGPTADYLPARKGQLFNPREYPWLETPWISDGVVLAVLRNLLIVHGERISYRALDVEQIGSVYEGIMGYAVRRIPGRCIGLKSKPQGAKKQITTAVDLEALLALPGGKRKAWLETEAGTALPTKSANALKAASSEAELLEALAPRINRDLFDGPQAAGGLVFQPTEERRRSGSHYTPRALTRPIVEEALRPWLERCHHRPTAAQILDLKICDPAMGSGAFLVESCRYLAELLEQAWTREGLPEALKPGGHAHGEEPLIYARRLIAQSCLYGVDKNPFAVNLARLSLWLVSLSKDAPFTFVDHALKCGDSLVGMERSDIEAALKGASLQRALQIEYLEQVRQQEARSFALFHADSRSDADDAQKRQALDELNASTAYLRTVGDLLVAAFFNGKKPKDREELKKLYLGETLRHSSATDLEDELAEPLERLREGEKGIQPLHWQLAFPDVFGRPEPGFDVFLGNPPFAGHSLTGRIGPQGYVEFPKSRLPGVQGKCDLSAYFFRRCFELLSPKGALALLATKTISQGDTASSSLIKIAALGGIIYSAKKRFPWPGDASVKVSYVCILKDPDPSIRRIINGKPARIITPYLLEEGPSGEPSKLSRNLSLCFIGTTLQSEGFVFEDVDNQRSASSSSSLQTMEEILQEEPASKNAIKRYLKAGDITGTSDCRPRRYAIDFGVADQDSASSAYPKLFEHLRSRAYEDRIKSVSSSNSAHGDRCANWWQHYHSAQDLYRRIEEAEDSSKNPEYLSTFTIVTPQTSFYKEFAIAPRSILIDKQIIAFPSSRMAALGILQSRIHLAWVLFFAATTESGSIIYSKDRCFERFPLPEIITLPSSPPQAPTQSEEGEALYRILSSLEQATSVYVRTRQQFMTKNSLVLRDFTRMINDPRCQDPEIAQTRQLLSEIDALTLRAYGFPSSRCAQYVYGLDEPVQLDDILLDGSHNADYFAVTEFGTQEEAAQFQDSYSLATSSQTRLPWRLRFSEEFQDQILARLLALNEQFKQEEVAQGLHGKGGKRTAPAAGPGGGKRRGRPPKTSQPGETEPQKAEQMGLGL
ncbi:DNA methyltransferase [Cyanobium sp. NIES-981]|uniref:Eco57I restriction-modification methylase domain-containing protein n=1 Tax=Cyanobium sp. NIES-981 TaxID=1851505 RepID=UPI001CED710E|nr:DNA methyltransferase [Cyanobium sp. NIES-981]